MYTARTTLTHRPNNKGFTLLEILIVTSILSVVTVLSFAGFNSISHIQYLQESVNEVESNMRYIQNQALNGVKPTTCSGTLLYYEVVFDITTDTYPARVICSSGITDLKTFRISQTAKLSAINIGASTLPYLSVRFRPDGKTVLYDSSGTLLGNSDDAFITLVSPKNTSLSHKLYFRSSGGIYSQKVSS